MSDSTLSTDSERRLSLEGALLSGVPVGVGQRAHCDRCGADLAPNETVEVLVVVDDAVVEIATLRGSCCARGQLRDETTRPCWLVRGTLAPSLGPGGRSRLILSGAEVIDRTSG